MSRSLDIFAGVLVAALAHGGAVFSEQLFPSLFAATAAPAATDDDIPTIALKAVTPPEPEPPDADDTVVPLETTEAPPAELAPPMQADTPAPVINPPFEQKLQPPPPTAGIATAAIAIPRGNFAAAGVALKNVFDINSLDQKPVPTFRATPVYPYEMRRSRINGRVLVGFIVDSDGNVRDTHIISSTNSGFDAEAIRAVARWKFRPGKKGGKAVHTRNVQVPFNFTIPDNE
ncbi:MAG: TonB family protein [Puniceicoccales bacterium]|jgi:protein TonB|nr:TonB family protein [Puniceicoccales bacterium]